MECITVYQFLYISLVIISQKLNTKRIKLLNSDCIFIKIYRSRPTKMAHSGYQKERFVNLSFDQFDCIICSEVVMDPMECQSCGHLFCKICINDWISKNPVTKCPNRCTASTFTPIKSKALLRTYSALRLKCSNPKCTQTVMLGDLKKHQQLCLKVKCWNFAVCQTAQNQSLKFDKPCCSALCNVVYQISQNQGNKKKLYQILTAYLPQAQVVSKVGGSVTGTGSIIASSLAWDSSAFGTGIVLSDANTSVFLKEQAYVFRTIIANIGFSSGINYWEIIADPRTQNQIKIGITSSKAFDLNSAFCDHPFGWAYYGLGQLRHGSNATGSNYGKRFKKEGVLGVCLNMNNGTLSFSLNGENMGVAFTDEKLKSGTYFPAVSLLHCAGCKIKGYPVPPAGVFN